MPQFPGGRDLRLQHSAALPCVTVGNNKIGCTVRAKNCSQREFPACFGVCPRIANAELLTRHIDFFLPSPPVVSTPYRTKDAITVTGGPLIDETYDGRLFPCRLSHPFGCVYANRLITPGADEGACDVFLKVFTGPPGPTPASLLQKIKDTKVGYGGVRLNT